MKEEADRGLAPEEIERLAAEPLPGREAMSLVVGEPTILPIEDPYLGPGSGSGGEHTLPVEPPTEA